MGKRKADAYEYTAEDDEESTLIEVGRQLLSAPKSKDALFKLLKRAGEALEHTPQGSEGAKLAIGDLAKALGKAELVKHKDKEIRLSTAFCLCNILRIYAPDTPYDDAQLKEIFGLFNKAYAGLEDPSGAHFQRSLAVFETVSQVKCSVLLLDLDAEDLICELFSTVFGAVNNDNLGMLEPSALEVLGGVLEETDEDAPMPQPLLDAILVNLLPQRAAESPAAHRLAQKLLIRTEAVMQGHLQRFLTNALTGMRTDSELRDDCHALIFQLYQTVPQVLLPVLQHLKPELLVEQESKRLAAAELLGKLLCHPGGGDFLRDYSDLLEAFLGRLHDQKVDVRLKVLGYCKGVFDNCTAEDMRRKILEGIIDRLMDPDDKARSAAAGRFCEVAAEHPSLAMKGVNTLLGRLRDKKLGVRKEVASQVAGLFRAWCWKAQQGLPGAPKKEQAISLLLVLVNLALRDAELNAHIMDVVFKSGMFPPKLLAAAQAEWWALIWQQSGTVGREALSKLLRAKCGLQRQVRELIALRDAIKEKRLAAGGATSSLAGSGIGSAMQQPSTSNAASGIAGITDPERALQVRLSQLARALPGVSKAEEGLQKLWEQKDNHIFRGLAAMAAYGTSLEDALAAGKDVVQRVGAKGPAAEVARALAARMSPSLLAPEVLAAAMELAADSHEAQVLLADVASAVPQLFAQSLDPLVSMLDLDDPLLADCAAKILARAGKYMAAASQGKAEAAKEWGALVKKLEKPLVEMCSGSNPSAAKAAVRALVALLGEEKARPLLKGVCDGALGSVRRAATLGNHPKLLTALKAVATVGRTLPELFGDYAAEFADFILDELLTKDLSRGKPLRQLADATGEEWGQPTPAVGLKAAAIKALAQGFVPDSIRAPPPKHIAEIAATIFQKLSKLLNPDEEAEEFAGIGLEGAVDGGAIRTAAAAGMLRMARAHDHILTAEPYVELALSMQDPHVEARRLLASKVVKTLQYLAGNPRRAAKYAPLLGLLAVDPITANVNYAFKALRDYVAGRRRALQQAAQAAAAAGGGGNMIQDMPEFALPFLIFILAHHPDYPSEEELREWEDMGDEERAEAEEEGQGHPLAPFQTMLQFVLEALVFPHDAPTNAAEIARTVPASLKLLRTIKYCEDADSNEQHTQNAHQLCDIAMALVKPLVLRATNGNPAEPGRFPGSVMLPCMLFRAKDIRGEGKKPDGSDLPEHFAPLLTEQLFSQLYGNMPGTAKLKGKGRGGGKGGGGGARGGKQQQQPLEDSAEAQGSGYETDESGGASLRHSEGAGGAPGSASKPKKRKAPSKARASPAAKHSAGEEGGPPPAKRSRAPPGSGQKKKGTKGKLKAESPAARQQPGRGAKAVAATKLRAESSDEEWEDEENGGEPVRLTSRQPAKAAVGAVKAAAAEDPMSQSDFENASMGSPALPPAAGGARGGSTLGSKPRSSLRANTDDEVSSQEGMGALGARRGGAAGKGARAGKGGAIKDGAGKGGGAGKVGRPLGRTSPSAVLKPKSKNLKAKA